MDEIQENKAIQLGQAALQANKDYLNTLKTHAEELEAELVILDNLINAVDATDEFDLNMGSLVTVPGSIRPVAPITMRELLLPESPFHNDALKRSRYRSLTEIHPMKTKELDALAEAVQAEYCRKHALDIQKRGASAFPIVDVQATATLEMIASGIDWERVAEKMSTISITPRSAKECEIRWLGEQHPEFNRGPWSTEEELKVKSLAAESTESHPDWMAIAEKLGTRRTPLDCMRHATVRKSHRWTEEADNRLLKAVQMYGHDNWYLVARYVSEDVTPSQCSNRFQRTLDKSIKHTPWSPEEDTRLCTAVAAYGSSWVDVASNIPGRHNDQCRERWTDQLDPSINKRPWTEEEDRILLDSVGEYKNASWKKTSQRLGNGRTEDMCRNRYIGLQKDVNAAVRTPAVNPEMQSVSFDRPAESSTTSIPRNCPATLTPLCTQFCSSNQLVFLEPVVSPNLESDKCHQRPSSQHKTRFKVMTTDGIASSNATNMSSSKRRKPWY